MLAANSYRSVTFSLPLFFMGGDPGVVVSTAAFHARVRGSVPGLGGLKETTNVWKSVWWGASMTER